MEKVLHLNLKRKWFNMIKSGEKKEEYRELTNYWFKRLFGQYAINPDTGQKASAETTYSVLSQNSDVIIRSFPRIKYTSILFSNGYAKDRDQISVSLHGIVICEGKKEWGALPGRKYFVITLVQAEA
jgi:hypothetical protein